MTDRETLIEEAGKAIREVRTVTSRGEDGYLSVGSADDETLARAALAVFEKALGEATVTPTDDEREALATALHKGQPDGVGLDGYGLDKHDARALADVALAAGFRRSEPQGEPSDAQLIDLYWKESGDDWSIPDWLMVAFGRAALRAANNIR